MSQLKEIDQIGLRKQILVLDPTFTAFKLTTSWDTFVQHSFNFYSQKEELGRIK